MTDTKTLRDLLVGVDDLASDISRVADLLLYLQNDIQPGHADRLAVASLHFAIDLLAERAARLDATLDLVRPAAREAAAVADEAAR